MKIVLAASMLASASAFTQKEVTAASYKVETKLKEIKERHLHPFEKDATLAAKVKELSHTANVKSLSASRSGNVQRSLRGKSGKGKGKGKDDDEKVSYLQIEDAFCAGGNMNGMTFTEDYTLASYQLKSGICHNYIDTTGDEPSFYSVKISYDVDENSKLLQHQYVYQLHDCVDDYLVDSTSTPDPYFEGQIPSNVCTPEEGGVGVKWGISQALLTPPMAGHYTETQRSYVNDCYEHIDNNELEGADLIMTEVSEIPTPEGLSPICVIEDSMSYQFDLSGCHLDPPVLTQNYFDNLYCGGVPELANSVTGEQCLYEFEVTEPHFISHFCSAGNMP